MQASSLGYDRPLLLQQRLLLPFLSMTSTSIRCRSALLLPWFLAFSLSFAVHTTSSSSPAPSPSPSSSDYPNAYYSNNPSTAWSLSDYYNSSDAKSHYLYRDFVICNNFSSYRAPLNDDKDQLLYGRCPPTTIISAHGLWKESLVSFALCFVLPPNTSTCTSAACDYLSLVVRKSSANKTLTKSIPIWTANTETPVSDNACLHLGEDSNLKLVDYDDNNGPPEVVWQTNTSSKDRGASLVITFEGNLVLFSDTTDPPYVPIWESFQHPTDTMMVLQVLQKPSNLTFPSIEGDSTNSQVAIAKSGMYTMMIENRGLVLYVRISGQDPPVPYWMSATTASSAANDIGFAALCWDSVNGLRLVLYAAGSTSPDLQSPAEISPESCLSDGAEFLGIVNISNANQPQPTNVTYATFLRLEADGDLHAYTTDHIDAIATPWGSFYSLFDNSPCDLPLYCGFYGFCDPQKKDNRCGCEPSFKLTDQSNAAFGCELELPGPQLPMNVSSLCSTAATDFVTISNVHYFFLNFTDPEDNHTSTGDQCQEKCQNVCNCTAAFWNESGNTCFLIQGRIGTIQKQGHMVAFIKYTNETGTDEQQRSQNSSSRRIVISAAVAATVFALAIAILACIYFLYKRRTAPNLSELEKERLLLSLLDSHRMPQRFTWKQLQEYTCGFSDFLGGGGFGSVFRGSLPDGTAIAVKQLDGDGCHGQGDKEFIAEVSILSRTEHVHLVQLLGFCFEGKRRLLVYEYMENGSLDRWLFKDTAVEEPWSTTSKSRRNKVLSWRQRYAIAVGTSKGMAYLHEECKDKVIHMDLKPQNILLDRHFMPKISDFGISKRMSREQTTAMIMTVMRGTPGYLAPEWLLDFAVTEKCDVYSFGIVLLEMVSGRKVRDLRALKRKLGIRSLAETVTVDVLDEDLKLDIDGGSDVQEEEVVRMVEVALLCVRTDPAKRPAMSSVALMLEGKAEVTQAAMDDCDDDEDVREVLELAMHKSSRNKTIRSMGRNDGNDDQSSSFNEDGGACSFSSMPSSSGAGTTSTSTSTSTSTTTRIRGRKYFQIDKL